MAGQQAAAQQRPPETAHDGKLRIYLFVQGEGERALAETYLRKYADDEEQTDPEAPLKPLTIQKTNEILVSDLHRDCIIVPVIRNPNQDRREFEHVEGTDDKLRAVETKGKVFECPPVDCAKFFTRVADSTGRNQRDTFDEAALVRAIGAACVVNRHALACPRIDARSDGHMRLNNWLVLRWG